MYCICTVLHICNMDNIYKYYTPCPSLLCYYIELIKAIKAADNYSSFISTNGIIKISLSGNESSTGFSTWNGTGRHKRWDHYSCFLHTDPI